MLSTLVIVALQHSRRVFWFSFDHWLSPPWFFSRTRTRLVFSFFFTQKTFFFFLWAVIWDIFISCSWPGFFCFFLVPWILVDIRLVNIYIYIYIYKDELISDVLLWTPTHGCARVGRPARTYIQQLCEDTGCNPEDLPEAMNDREKWRETVRDIRAGGATWWWWYIYIYSY